MQTKPVKQKARLIRGQMQHSTLLAYRQKGNEKPRKKQAKLKTRATETSKKVSNTNKRKKKNKIKGIEYAHSQKSLWALGPAPSQRSNQGAQMSTSLL